MAHFDPELFFKQNEIVCLFYGNECAGLFFSELIHLQSEFPQMKYFDIWPKETLPQIKRDGPIVIIAHNFTVNKKLNKELEHLSLKNLVMGMVNIYFQFNQRSHSLIANVRESRNVHKLASLIGTISLRDNIQYNVPLKSNLAHIEEVSLVCLYKNEAQLAFRQHPGAFILTKAWNEFLTESNGIDLFDGQKKAA